MAMKLPKFYFTKYEKGYWDILWGWFFLKHSKSVNVFRIHPSKPGTSALFMVWLVWFKRIVVYIWKLKVEVEWRSY